MCIGQVLVATLRCYGLKISKSTWHNTHKDIVRRHRNEVFSLIPVATGTVLEYWPLGTRWLIRLVIFQRPVSSVRSFVLSRAFFRRIDLFYFCDTVTNINCFLVSNQPEVGFRCYLPGYQGSVLSGIFCD